MMQPRPRHLRERPLPITRQGIRQRAIYSPSTRELHRERRIFDPPAMTRRPRRGSLVSPGP